MAHAELVADRTVVIAHLVMLTLLVAFVVLSWSEMATGALRVWRTVILLGIPVTLAGTVSFLPGVPSRALQTVAVVGWMGLPAWGLIETGRRMPADVRPRVYTLGGVASAVGAVVYLAGSALGGSLAVWLTGITFVAVGQTVGILLAVRAS